MQSRQIGQLSVSAIGFGCMNVSHGYGPAIPLDAAGRLLNQALDSGYTLLDTAALYGFGANETLLGNSVMHRRHAFTLASKCGLTAIDGKRVLDGRPVTLKATCEASLRRLRTDVIDLYYLHRLDPRVPVEDSTGALADLVAEGKIRAIGLSEVSAATLRRANRVHPITAVQSEYSLWTRNPEYGVLETCRELNIGFVAFSPVARGFLCGAVGDVGVLSARDLRRTMPRFQPPHYEENCKLLKGFAALAKEAGCTMPQLALAWILAQGEHVVPIPGTTNPDHLTENAAAAYVSLSPDMVRRLDALINPQTVHGPRYDATAQADIDTEEGPA